MTHFDLFEPLSPHRSPVFYLHCFTPALCGKGWLEGYNLEETWDPITDTNIQSPHAALSPPVSHIMVTAAGLCLLGTRHPACLSHSGSQLQFLTEKTGEVETIHGLKYKEVEQDSFLPSIWKHKGSSESLFTPHRLQQIMA